MAKKQGNRPAMSRIRVGANTNLFVDAGRINYFESFDEIYDNGRLIYRDYEGAYVTESWSEWAANKNNIYLYAIHDRVTR